jgi:hypothetical protein
MFEFTKYCNKININIYTVNNGVDNYNYKVLMDVHFTGNKSYYYTIFESGDIDNIKKVYKYLVYKIDNIKNFHKKYMKRQIKLKVDSYYYNSVICWIFKNKYLNKFKNHALSYLKLENPTFTEDIPTNKNNIDTSINNINKRKYDKISSNNSEKYFKACIKWRNKYPEIYSSYRIEDIPKYLNYPDINDYIHDK